MRLGTILSTVCIVLIQMGLGAQSYKGFYNFEFDEATGKMLLEIDKIGQDFLMVNGYGTGIGANEIGMDRGKLGEVRLVRFEKHGDKILLIQPNLSYRATSSNPNEVNAVVEAFAQSVIYGFKIEKKDKNLFYVDISPLILEDLNQVVNQLKEAKQGIYKLDKSKSALYFENIMAFPENIEFESILSFAGEATGQFIKQVVPSPEYVTYRQHVSFIKLPENGFKPRVFHPESGYFFINYYDYATPIHTPIEKRFITRHRLSRKNPSQGPGDPIKPIIYYIDPGCPEPIKSALIEGGKWWSQAFESAGFTNAFDIRELPKNAHPMDVRYNMIQWVHRNTRGWSYGSSITDPRTGEIIKGHVTLGSLRVRQDFMLAQGISSPYSNDNNNHEVITKMALDRLRQLSAHEIGHTLGLAHNFASSANDRASVMDYPHPLIHLNEDGSVDFSRAYDDKIGIWDKRAILYGYSIFDSDTTEIIELKKLIDENHHSGLRFLTDEDARSPGSASPVNHLWDNGQDPVKELERILTLRTAALKKFGLNTIPNGTPVSELEKILVPLYFMHRYQAEAVSKLIGGLEYTYAVKGFGKIAPLKSVSVSEQDRALNALLKLLDKKHLVLPEQILQWLYPPAYGYPRSRESFPTSSGPAFDAAKVYESASGQIIDLLLQPQRLMRLSNENRLAKYLSNIAIYLQKNSDKDPIIRNAEIQFLSRLLVTSIDDTGSYELKTILCATLQNYLKAIKHNVISHRILTPMEMHTNYINKLLTLTAQEIKELKAIPATILPPGAPIGSCGMD